MNYQSIPRRFNKPTSNINHSYIDATLREKQKIIDTNYGLLQQGVEKVLGQDLVREQDREYLKSKVSNVLNALDNTAAIKFDSRKSQFAIQDALSEAAKDPEVLKQVANTKKLRQIQKFQQDRQKKGTLNQQNFAYAANRAGLKGYLDGSSDDLGDFQYLEYVDVDAKLDESARKLKAANPNELVSIQDPLTGKTVSKKVSLITPEEMRNYLRVQLNANDLKQLEIDGAMLYGLDNKRAVEFRDSLISKSNTKYADKIALLENYRDNGNKTKGEIARINNEIKSLSAAKTSFERNMIGRKTAEAIGGQQLIEDKMDLFSKLYTKNGPESIKYDSATLKRLRDANSRGNLNGVSPDITTITTPTSLPETVDPYKDSLKRIDNVLRENSNYLTTQFNALNSDQKKLVDDTMKEIKNDPEFLAAFKGQPISNETLQLETINRLGPNFFPPDVAKELRSRISNTKAIQEGIEETTSEFVKTQTAVKETFDQVFNEETALTMATPRGDINIKQFLTDNGVRDYDSYKTFMTGDSKEAKQLRATLSLQSLSLTSDDPVQSAELTDNPLSAFNVFSGIGSTSTIDLNESEYRIMRQAAHDLTGESLDETYNISKKNGNYTLNLKNPRTNLATIVDRTNQLYQEGRVGLGDIASFGTSTAFGLRDTDRTARNESTLRNLFSEQNYEDFASENLKFIDKTVAGSNAIRVKGDNKKNVGPLYEEVLQYVDNATFDKRLPIDLYKTQNGEIIVTQIVQDETAISDDEAKRKQKIRRGTIQANDVPKLRVFNNQISLVQQENTFKTLEDFSGKVSKMTFIGDNRAQVEGLNRLYDRNNKGENTFRLLSAEKTARDIIFNPSVDPYVNRTPQGLEIKAQFEDFVTNTQNYELDFTKGVDSDYQVLIRDKDGNDIGSVPLNRNIPLDVFEKTFYGAPQAFLSLYTKSKVDKYMRSIIKTR